MSTVPDKRHLARTLSKLRGFIRTQVNVSLRSASSVALEGEHDSQVILPNDILIQTIMFLDWHDVLSASKVSSQQYPNSESTTFASVQVCRHFNEATKATVVWRKLASETQRASGFLALDPFKLQNLPNRSTASLREAVVRTRVLEKNWLKDYAKPSRTWTLNMAGFERPSTWQAEDQTRYFISERFVITASPGCLIEALGLSTRTIMKSNYRVSDEPEGAVLSPNFALENTSLYFAEYQNHTIDDDDISK